jgi:hypothetical protein
VVIKRKKARKEGHAVTRRKSDNGGMEMEKGQWW